MDALSLTRELVAINSVNPFETYEHNGRVLGLGNETRINAYLEEKLRSAGFSVERQLVQEEVHLPEHNFRLPARYNLLAEKGEGKKSLLFYGHTDTVDVKEGWETDPFTATEKIVEGRKRLYGLGTNDMKAGLAVILAGTEHIRPLDYKLKVAFLVDEELWSFGAVSLLQSDFIKDVELAISPELAEGGGDPEELWLGVGRLGRCEFQFEIVGRGCHGADALVDGDAVNAVHEAVKVEAKVLKYCEKARRVFSQDGISVTNSAYINFHEGGRATLSVPDRASFILDRSLVPGESAEAEEKALQALLKPGGKNGFDSRARISLSRRSRPTPPCKPYFISPKDPQVTAVAGLLGRFGAKYRFGISRSVSDENRLAEHGICTLTLQPHGSGSHTSSEWVDAESVTHLAEIYKALAMSGAELLKR